MTDVREIHGVARAWKVSVAGHASTQNVTAEDAESWVRLSMDTSSYPADLTPDQARHLASKLYRLARIIEARKP